MSALLPSQYKYKNQRSSRLIQRDYYSLRINLYLFTFILQPQSSLVRQRCQRYESKRADQSWDVIYWFQARRQPSLKDCSSQMAFTFFSFDQSWRFYWASLCTQLLSQGSDRSIRSSILPWLNFNLLIGCLLLAQQLVLSTNPVYFLVSSLLLTAVVGSLTLLTVSPGDQLCCRWKVSCRLLVWLVLCCLAADSFLEILMISSYIRWKREEWRRRGVRQSFIIYLQNYHSFIKNGPNGQTT